MQISAKLGLRARRSPCSRSGGRPPEKSPPGFTLYKVMSLPAAYTKGANAMGRSASKYTRRTVSFSVEAFDQVVAQIVDLAKAGVDVDPKRFYPAVKKRARGQSRDLPLVDEDLREALTTYRH